MKLEKSLLFTLLICVFFPFVSNADQLEDAISAIGSKDYKKAHELLKPLVDEGNAAAQTRLGAMYVNGQGVEMDLAKGLGLIMEAANQGYDKAQGIALKIYMDIASTGDTGAMYNAGGLCLKGWAGAKDKTACLEWLEQAARLGHERSGKVLNKIYAKGMYGITLNEEEATYWNDLLVAFAAGLDGEWSGEEPNAFGGPPSKLTFTFETNGNNLTGTILGFGGKKNQLIDGKIDGNDFSFRIKLRSFGGTSTTTEYTGTFLGDRLKLTYTTKMNTDRRRRASLAQSGVGGELPPVTLIAKRVE
ncbi:tetratricopeptide repeat protein [Thermodesulfobacteriota bacterium]